MVRPVSAEWQRTLDRLKTRISVSRPVRLLVSGRLQAPAAMGWLRPIVLVPAGALAGLPVAQIEALLLHELAHIRRHDYPVHILQSAVEAVFFYHPAVWWVSSHMRAERELCCDDIAVSVTGDAVIYARALAEFDSARWIQPNVMAANGGSLADRIARLLGQPSTSRRPSCGPGTAPALILLAIGAWAVFAQPTVRAQFEVASVKPSFNRSVQNVRPLPGRLTADATLQILIQYAYGVQPFQVVGAPAWMQSGRYQIEAKADGNANRARMFLMLQSLLEDRFQLRTHRDTRDLPVYALVAAKGGFRLPPPKEGGCVDSTEDASPEWAGAGRMAAPGEVEPATVLCGSAGVSLNTAGARIQGGKVAMPELVRMLSRVLGRSVIDRTGFTGLFDLQLDFVADETTPAMPPPPPDSGMSGLPIPQALRQQLGLQLESTKGPVEVIVVDHAERPSGN
ncbi:MAG TPA: M56 family metallopeptidase, partial [Candidatus Acidoferrales bacterium]|nr:M56 family metallopeptidase [Candidatus Acidoferrales bacterium]